MSPSSSTSASRAVIFLAVALCLCQSAFAHNWMHTTGRATRQASTQRPCAARKVSDTHVQVGPSQEFSFKWATGHNRFTYVILIKGEDYDWLGHKDFQIYIDDYIKSAPANSDTSKTAKWRRYHGSRTDLSRMIGSHFKAAVNTSTVPHPETESFKFMYDFTDEKLATDARVSYKSDKYPWLLMVGKFNHDTDRPGDHDGINMMIPNGSPPGHYIAHWRWSGYYDCVDIDYRPTKINSSLIYGEGAGGFVFDRIDHCSVVDPQLVLTPFVSAKEGIESCLNALQKGSGSFGTNVPGHGEPTKRVALSVIPSTMPTAVPALFRKELGLPMTEERESLLYQTDWFQLKGTESTSFDNWMPRWQRDLVANVTCASVISKVTTTIKDAIIRCGRSDCLGIAFPADINFLTPDKKYDFSLCKAKTTKVDTKFSVAWKKDVAPPATKLGTKVAVSFSQASHGIPAAAQYLSDSGLEFGAKGQFKYGWLCNITSRYYGSYYEKTQEKSFINMPLETCTSAPEAGGLPARNLWEIEVPNGVYKVTFMFINYGTPIGCTTARCRDVDTSSCALENLQVEKNGFRNKIQDTYEKTVQVEVLDGRLTLSSSYSYYGNDARSLCRNLATLSFQRVADSLPSVWFPSSTNPWVQTELPAPRAVGYVYLTAPDSNPLDTPGTRGGNWPDAYSPMNTCDSWHLWKSDRCYGSQPVDLFAHPFEGATVGVSNIPCAGQTCMGVCGTVKISWNQNIHEPATGVRGRQVFGRPFVNCKGAVGKYMWVQLPGTGRILNFKPMFTTTELPKDTQLCYGVVPRYPTELLPEYITSNDPEDPVFYSTCYMREFDKTWQFPIKAEAVPKTWRFSGQCVDCPSYSSADSNFTTAPLNVAQPPLWATTSRCVNCDASKKPAQEPLVLVNKTATCNSTTPSAKNCLKDLLTEDNRPVTSEGQCSVVTRQSKAAGCGSTFVYTANLCQCYLASCGDCSLVKDTKATVYKLN